MLHLITKDNYICVMSIQKSQIILTKHAISRGKQRYITQDRIEQTLMYPEKSFQLEESKTKFIRTINSRQFQVIASYLPKESSWLVVSVWVRGEEDRRSLTESMLESIWHLLAKWFTKLKFNRT